jgi:hypothetical protein
MYAQTSTHRPQTTNTTSGTAAPSRAVLQTRPMIQRALIRSWEYQRPYRITIVAIRMLVVLWLLFLAGELTTNGYAAGWALVPAAFGVFAIALWVFRTAAAGWPVDQA